MSLAFDLPTLSVVAPVFREESGINAFITRCRKTLDAIELEHGWELILVDDGSPDDSIERIREDALNDQRIRVVRLSRNFGHQVAITAGIDFSRGDAVVIIDSDLQDPPETIADMVTAWRGGAEVVFGVRSARKGEGRLKVLSARAFYRLLSRISDTPLSNDAGDFRLLDRRVVQTLKEMHEENRYLRGMVSWIGFRQVAVPYVREPRFAGRSAYTFRRMVKLAMDGVTGFSERPLRIAFELGMLVTAASFIYLVWILVTTLFYSSRLVPGYASLMCVLLFLGGIQLLSVGLLGEYVGRIYRESKRRPLYVVKDLINVEAVDHDGRVEGD